MMHWWGQGTQTKKIDASSTVGITESGKREVTRYASRGDAFTLLSILEDKSPQTVSKVAEEAQMTTGEALQRLKILQRQGYVRFTGE